MQEQLITFETAKLAKELGFNIPTFNYFYKNGDEVKECCVEEYPFNPIDWNNNTPEDYSRPCQSILQRWLRDENMMSIKIDDFYTDGKIKFDYNISVLGSQDDNPMGIFDTYEKALEEALFETLTYLKK